MRDLTTEEGSVSVEAEGEKEKRCVESDVNEKLEKTREWICPRDS